MVKMTILILTLLQLVAPIAFGASLDLSNLNPEARARAEKILPPGQDEISNANLDNLVRHLITDQQFDSAEVLKRDDGGKVIYSVRVGKVRRITSLRMTGYDAFSESDLRREFGLSEKSQFEQQALIDAAERVRQFYESQGYAQAKVDLEFHSQKDDGVQVEVRVSEGPQTTIKEFEIVADNPDLRNKLRNALRGFRNDPINEKTMSELRTRIREFLSQNKFFRSEIQDPQIVKTDELSKSKLIYRFNNSEQYALEFRGNAVESDRNILSALNLDQFTSSNPNVGAELGSKIKNFYISSGYARAEVHVDEVPSTQHKFTKVLQFTIKEGPRVGISHIEWIGRFSESAKTYTRFLKDHSSDMLAKGWYVKEDIDTGLKNLIIDRRNQGFLKAKIVSTRASNNPQKNEVTLQINFDEGPLTQIRSIKFTGAQQLPEEELRGQLDFQEGEPLKLNKLEDSVVKLKRFYQSRGYLEMAITNEKQDLVLYNEDNTLVDVVYQIYEGPKVSVGSIILEGNTITKDYVIYKELEFKVGDILTPEKIDESTARLQRVGHFSSIEIKTVEERTATAVRTVLVRVTDRNPGLVLLGVGVSNERNLTFRGYGGLAYRNIGGMGRGLSGRIDANYTPEIQYPERKFTVGYLEPYLFDTRSRGRVNLTQAYTINPTIQQQGSELRQTTWTIEQDLTSHILISWDLYNLAKYRDFKVPSEEDLKAINNTLSIGSTQATIDIDFRDHPFNPTRGTFTRLNLEWGTPEMGSNDSIRYYRVYGSFTHYQNMGILGIVWANSLRGGFLQNIMNNGAVPYDKRGFLLGGESTIRGFSPGEAFPNAWDFKDSNGIGLPDYDASNSRFNLRTDATMYLVKSEIRFPIWKSFGGAVFYDGGSVTIRDLNFDRPYRDAIGIAARYATPVGAFSLEYGWKLNRRPERNESPTVFNISVGTF